MCVGRGAVRAVYSLSRELNAVVLLLVVVVLSLAVLLFGFAVDGEIMSDIILAVCEFKLRAKM